MRQIINNTLFITVVMLLIQSTSFATCTGDNIFTGATSTDWGTASNWSAGCVPGRGNITGVITIQADCVVSGSTNYTFSSGGKLIIDACATFTNNGTGTLAIEDLEVRSTTYENDLTVNGTIEPEPQLEYGGQSYTTVGIGTQCWMAENLNIGYRMDSNNSADNQTDDNIIEKYCYGNDESNCNTYGGLYQWNEMMQYTNQSTQGVCPTGWHIPSDGEWTTLTDFLDTDVGSKMAGNEILWTNGALNSNGNFGDSGFEALPGGGRREDSGLFQGLSQGAAFWSSSDEGGSTAWGRYLLFYDDTDVGRSNGNKDYGLSVRCVRD